MVEGFDSLKLARARVKEFAREIADERSAEGWREVILVEGSSHGNEVQVFGYGFSRALVAGKRKRSRRGDAYGEAESYWGTIFEIEYDERLWAELEAFAELEEWFNDLRGSTGWGDDSPGKGFDVAVLLRYLRGRARVLRDLREGRTDRVPLPALDDR